MIRRGFLALLALLSVCGQARADLQTFGVPRLLTSPIISGTVTGTYTLGGTPTITGLVSANGWAPVFGVYPTSLTISNPGTGYVPGDSTTSTCAGCTITTAPQLAIGATQAVSPSVSAGGTTGVNGACTVTDNTNTANVIYTTRAQFTGTVVGNALTGPLTVAVPGQYAVANPASPMAVTGCSLTGATVSVSFGALILNPIILGNLSSTGTQPATFTQTATSGSGTALTYTAKTAPVSSDLSWPTATGAAQADADIRLGSGALAVSTGAGNIAVGGLALQSNTKGVESVAIGHKTLQVYTGTCTSGNLGIGTHVLGTATTGCNLIGVGTDSNGTTIASDVIAIGVTAVNSDNGGTIIGIGTNAAKLGTTARTSIVAIGQTAAGLSSAMAGRDIVAVGHSSLTNASLNANRVVAVGTSTLDAVTTGANITAVGHFVGNATCATGAQVLLLGTSSGTDCTSGAESNAIHIGAGGGDIIFVTGTGTNTTAVPTIHGLPKLPDVTTGTPTASLCIDASNNIIKKTTAGSCV